MSDLPAWWDEPHPCDGQLDVMFAPGARKDGTAAARAICATCPHIEPCRTWARDHGEPFGVWGGEGPRTRFAATKCTTLPRRKAVAECGTVSGHHRHIDRDEPICEPCRQAWRDYMRRLRERSKGAA